MTPSAPIMTAAVAIMTGRASTMTFKCRHADGTRPHIMIDEALVMIVERGVMIGREVGGAS